MLSCSSSDNTDGPNWKKIFEQDEYTIDHNEHSLMCTSISGFYYIVNVYSVSGNNTKNIYVKNPEVNVQSISGDWFSIKTVLTDGSEIPNIINVVFTENVASEDRKLVIKVQRANNFQELIFTQKSFRNFN